RLEQIAEQEPFIDVSAFELLKAMRRIQEFAYPSVREVVKQEIKLEDKIEELFAIVRVRLKASLTQLIRRSRSTMEAVVFFLAALELARQKALRIQQAQPFGEIEVTLRNG
ncbi:MAG: segregation/condensation protein A, partial [bacterium]